MNRCRVKSLFQRTIGLRSTPPRSFQHPQQRTVGRADTLISGSHHTLRSHTFSHFSTPAAKDNGAGAGHAHQRRGRKAMGAGGRAAKRQRTGPAVPEHLLPFDTSGVETQVWMVVTLVGRWLHHLWGCGYTVPALPGHLLQRYAGVEAMPPHLSHPSCVHTFVQADVLHGAYVALVGQPPPGVSMEELQVLIKKLGGNYSANVIEDG